MKRFFQTIIIAGMCAGLLAVMPVAASESFSPLGKGTLRWFGLKIYEADLSVAPGFAAERFLDSGFALELTYARKLYGKAIAERSVEEMKKQGIGTRDQHEAWLRLMESAFPDVAANDRLKGVHLPKQGAQFFYNGRLIKTVDDPAFSAAFFSIWLSPKTSEPDLRKSLLQSALKQ